MTKKKKMITIGTIAVLAVILINSVITRSLLSGYSAVEVTYDEFLSQLEAKNVDLVQVEDTTIYYTLSEEAAEAEDADGYSAWLSEMLSQAGGDMLLLYYPDVGSGPGRAAV